MLRASTLQKLLRTNLARQKIAGQENGQKGHG